MLRKRSAVEQRREQITAQVEHLRQRLAMKTRKDYSSDFYYERWKADSNALIDELIAELSVLDDPGEYYQLPPAVIADELGTTTVKVRLLIKGGEILALGKPAHEYVNREELAAASEAGVKELMRCHNQGAAEIFEESVEYLRQGQLRLAERACQRLIARESIVGIHALPYETALLLAKSELGELDARLRFIEKAEDAVKTCLLHNLRRILRGVSFGDEIIRATAERLIYGEEENTEGGHKVLGSKLDERQQFAMFVTTVIFNELGRLKMNLQAGKEEQLRQAIRDAVYSSLHAHDSYDYLASSREFVDAIRVLMPRYYRPAKLLGNLATGIERNHGNN